jgi:hypothetical protein
LQYAAWFAVGDNEMAGTSKVYGQEIKVWPYPEGGHWILRLDGTFDAQGLAISPAP